MSGEQEVINEFHQLYYHSYVWLDNTRWLGIPLQKCPLDLWIYQEILFEIQPDVIIETGTYEGGSALFLASICDLIGRGRVTTIDIDARPNRPQHGRITYLHGSSTAPETVNHVAASINDWDKVLVILDSDHHQDHILTEMRLYGQFVTPGSYLIVEDTNINGHPVLPEFGPGPMEAVNLFLMENNHFVRDSAKEKFHLTFYPGGFLKRI